VVNGHTWTKIGWQLFNPAATNTGWYVPQTNYLYYAWAASSSSNALQRSYIYDDFNQEETFVYALANGVYDVEVGMGRPGAVSQALVTVNGTSFFGDPNAYVAQSITNNVSATRRLEVVNGSLVMETGQQINGNYNYVDYLGITAVSPSSPDGLDDLWQTTYFGSATNVLAAPYADPDGDGVNNITEYYFGTDPTSSSSRPWFTASLPATGVIQLQWSSASNQLYQVQSSGDLNSWSVALAQVLATSSTTTVTLLMPGNSTQEFYRVVAGIQ
jgi:hypothetical protein